MRCKTEIRLHLCLENGCMALATHPGRRERTDQRHCRPRGTASQHPDLGVIAWHLPHSCTTVAEISNMVLPCTGSPEGTTPHRAPSSDPQTLDEFQSVRPGTIIPIDDTSQPISQLCRQASLIQSVESLYTKA